jgi:hypothetical protein
VQSSDLEKKRVEASELRPLEVQKDSLLLSKAILCAALTLRMRAWRGEELKP